MSALPPWVIEDSTANPLQMLTPVGWADCVGAGNGAVRVSNRSLALSFHSEEEAQAWIDDAKRFTPAIFRGRTAIAVERKHKPVGFHDEFGGGHATSDYEPYGGAV